MKKIPVVAFNLTTEQEAKIMNCSNSICFEIVHEGSLINSDFMVVVNGVDVSVDFLNLMLWGKNLYENDNDCVFIDSYTPINEQLPKNLQHQPVISLPDLSSLSQRCRFLELSPVLYRLWQIVCHYSLFA